MRLTGLNRHKSIRHAISWKKGNGRSEGDGGKTRTLWRGHRRLRKKWRSSGSRPRCVSAWAANIKRLRIESGLSLRAFAMKANVSPSYLSEAERGLRGVTVDLLVRMAIGLNVSLETLFEE